MASSCSRFFASALFSFLCVIIVSSVVHAQLSPSFYSTTCPKVQTIVSSAVSSAVGNDRRLGASLLRLFFHDCFVQGCDGSILLDGGEKTQPPNLSLNPKGFTLIDTIKTSVEASCPGVVSCADILAIATLQGVKALRGPSWALGLGRKDSRTADPSGTTNLPPPTSSLAQLISKYGDLGFSVTDMVALSGAHTIGQAQCSSFNGRIYNDVNIDPNFATLRKSSCPQSGSTTLAPLDIQTPTNFDNKYYNNLLGLRGLLHSDQELFNNGSTDSLVKTYSINQAAFFKAFSAAMTKMSNLSPPGGVAGEIRKNCRLAN